MMDRPGPEEFDLDRLVADLGRPPVAPLAMPRQALTGPAARAILRGLPRARATTLALRAVAIGASLVAAVLACWLFLWIGRADGHGLGTLDLLRSALIFATTWWLAWGAMLALIGLVIRPPTPQVGNAPLTARSVLIVPVYNEEPAATFARIAATAASLAETGMGHLFDIAILSDSRDDDVALAERQWVLRLSTEVQGVGRLIYRRRADNAGRKAGNIEEFLSRSGGAWDFALILDADSLMEGRTIVTMARRMQADPGLGLLQTLPHVIRARSRFGRAMQFAAALHAPVFARGLAALQGGAGPFWGHNAMIRIAAFAGACGLPALPGRAPFGGSILSHDTVEAAFLVRAGWRVRVDPDLEGSFEEAPENMIDHARRDRRWCQGNLQHLGLIHATGLTPWSRFAIAQGVMAYLAPVLWLGFLGTSLLAAATAPDPVPVFDELGRSAFFPIETTGTAMILGAGIIALLFLPKLLIAMDAMFTGRAARFGGARSVLRSTGAELLLSSIIAPVQMMFQSRAVFQVLMGLDAGWPPQSRAGGRIGWAEAIATARGFVLAGAAALIASLIWAPDLTLWLMPVMLPLLASPGLVKFLSHEDRSGLFMVPCDVAPAPVTRRFARLHLAWRGAREVEGLAPEAAFPLALRPAA
jgi:membrane glycosyltransferase